MPIHISSVILYIFCAMTLQDYFIFVTGFMPLDMSAFTNRQKTTKIQRVEILPKSQSSTPSTISTRSTPEPTKPPRTPFDLLRFWSGESLRLAKEIENDQRKYGENPRINEESGRRAYKKQLRSTRFTLVDATGTLPEKIKNTNVKINGYTLKQDLMEIMREIDENITISTIGSTIEYNDIVLLKMSKKPKKYFRALEGENKYVEDEVEKKIILIVHGLTPMGFRFIPCLYRAESFLKLVKMYASYLDKFDIFLIPMGNPDGIADESLIVWNKNKSPQSTCSGVNVDRNFDVSWNKSSHLNSCSMQFPGPRAFSERESRAVADLIHHYTPRIIAYIHVHAGTYNPQVFKGDAVLFPRGYTDEQTDDDKYIDMEAEIEETMRNAGFKMFGVTMTSMYKWYGKVSGSSVDYATTVYGIPYGLEFVMQPYVDKNSIKLPGTNITSPFQPVTQEITDIVLTEVWRRIIDVVFNKIYKGTGKSISSEFRFSD